MDARAFRACSFKLAVVDCNWHGIIHQMVLVTVTIHEPNVESC